MANPISLPLQERIPRKNTLQRTLDLIVFFLLISFLLYRLLSLNDHGITWMLAFLCELWFTFICFLTLNIKWNPVEYKTYPQRLLKRNQELPPVDLFVTTADPVLEPPIITVNTVLSLLALDYPPHKLACYVSDDGASPVTFYSLLEASKFAKLWVPFCKKYNVQVRAPFLYLSDDEPKASGYYLSSDFWKDWRKMKNEYEQLSHRIEEAVQNPSPCDLTGEFAAFSKIDRTNHPSIVKVIWENKENGPDGLPHLVYVSREKRPKHPHRFKAGAMNVLTRVSGVMTNSPFMLNVDCDMFANNPQIVLHAMCYLLDTEKERECGFVQCPQQFHGGLKDDPFGNQLVVLQECLGRGVSGIQGPFYGGTGCFHRRKVIYGLSPNEAEIKERKLSVVNGKSSEEELKKRFGYSTKFAESAAQIMSGKNQNLDCLGDLSSSLEAATQAADCLSESNTYWGTKVGWVYGSTTEDVLTGLRIHASGWESVFITPDPPAFLGCAPSGGPASLTQQKRWATGLLEILLSNNSPIVAFITRNLRFRQCLAYIYLNLWAPRFLPELCYAALPAYCLITNTSFLPAISEPAIFIPGSIFVISNLSSLLEYLFCGLSIRAWWNNQRMRRITTLTAWLFGFLSVILKLLGLSETVFEVTQKDQSTSDNGIDADAGSFTFDDSPIFVPGVALVLVHMIALFVSLLGVQAPIHGAGSGLGEIICSAWVMLSFLPFVKGLFRKGKYGIPLPTICKSAALAGLFVHFCRWYSSWV